MNKLLVIFILLTIFVCPNQKVYAQWDRFSKGDRIRITATKYFVHPIPVTVMEIYSASLYFRIHIILLVIPIHYSQKFKISNRKRMNTFYEIIARSLGSNIVPGLARFLRNQKGNVFGTVGYAGIWNGFASDILAGDGIGAVIANRVQSEKWEPIPMKKMAILLVLPLTQACEDHFCFKIQRQEIQHIVSTLADNKENMNDVIWEVKRLSNNELLYNLPCFDTVKNWRKTPC